MRRFSTTMVLSIAFGGACVGAVWAETPVRNHDIEPEDYFTLGFVGQCALSPHGKYVAYTETRWEPPAEKRNTDLWVVDTTTKTRRRLTFDRAGDGSPRWSPDGRTLYFSSTRKGGDGKPPFDGKRQVWRIPVEGGPPFAVTRVKDGIKLFDLSKDGKTLYYTTSKEEVEKPWKALRTKFKKLHYGHGVNHFSPIYKLDLESWRTQKLVDEKRVIRAMKVSPDQSRIAMITTPDENLIANEGWSRVDVYDVASDKVSAVTPEGWRKDHPSPYGWLGSASWSADSRSLAFTTSFDGYPTMLYVARWQGDEVSLQEQKRPPGVTITGGTIRWRGTSHDLCFRGDEHARARVYCLQDVRDGRQGDAIMLTPEEGVVGAYSFSISGDQLAFVMGTTTHTPDVHITRSSGGVQRLTNINEQVDTWKLPQMSIVSWKGSGGVAVEGILELPPDYQKGKPLPMVVEIHGGPTSASMFSLRFWIYGRTLLPARGFALLSPNYRGSTGYGDQFMTDLVGRENDIEVEDILKGVDAMVAQGIADPDRLGVMGWSNGGFLTNCLITTTDRFKAASSGAGVLDMIIQWGTEDTPGHVINYMKGLPWSIPEAYRKGSPIYHLGRVRTPTLIHVGEHDPRVPPAHARTLYRALRRYLHVPTELVIYPGEGHGLSTYTHRKAKMKWDIAWFERYLLNKTDKDSPASEQP